jgi:hypothetical protein
MPLALDEKVLQRIRQEDLDTLVDLDRRGLTPAPNEDGDAFAARLQRLAERLSQWEDDLRTAGRTSLEGITLKREDAIPAELLAASGKRTKGLYGFQCDWVPGYFCSPSHSWLFGGCTFSAPPDLFTVFIISQKLRTKKRHLFYDRDEILSHELCHVARTGLQATEFEEHFAYQTSTGAFRRNWGGIMHSQWDSFLFLALCLLLPIGQLVLPQFAPSLPLWLNWIPLLAALAFFVLRHLRSRRHFQKALQTLQKYACHGDEQKARILLFHATDQEIHALAKLYGKANGETLFHQTLDAFRKDLRWKVALHRAR